MPTRWSAPSQGTKEGSSTGESSRYGTVTDSGSGVPTTGVAQSVSRVPALDGLRGLAVLMVVGLHVGFLVGTGGRSYVPGGLFGVDVFFVLSGFLITALLLQERHKAGRYSFKNFYLRRAFRLLPALAGLLAAEVVYALVDGRSIWHVVEPVASIALYVSNITQSLHVFMPAELTHTWSLAVEEQFYLFWPALLLLTLAWRVRRRQEQHGVIPWIVPIGIVATVAVRIVMWRTVGYPADYMLLVCRSDALLMGCGLAFLYDRGRLPRAWAGMAGWAGLGGLLLLAFAWNESSPSVYYGVFTLVAVLSAAVINALMVTSGRLAKVFSWKPLVGVGRVSYGLYLWHVWVLNLLLEHPLGLGVWPRACVGLAVSAVVTWLSWRLIEQPALRLKRRFGSVPLRRAPAMQPS